MPFDKLRAQGDRTFVKIDRKRTFNIFEYFFEL